jgi:hypothetical protein
MGKFLGNIRLLGGVVLLGFALPLFLFQKVKADDPSWLNSNLAVQKQADFSVVPPSLNGNINCLPEGPACVVNAGYGYANQNGQVKLKGTSTYRDVVSFVDNRVHTLAIPNSNTMISYTAEPAYGLYFYFTKNFTGSISATSNFGSTQYAINRAPDAKLADKSGQRLAADYASLNLSENGQWMIISSPNVAMLRVNLETFEVLPFGPAYNYTIGLSPNPHTAITNDGRWAAMASKDFDNFLIYDLSSCNGPAPNVIIGPQTCQSKDLNALLKQQIPGYVSVSNLKFISNDTLSAYVSYRQGSILKVARYIISTSQGTVHQLDYLALGDSYISGEGAYHYRTGTDTSDNVCHLSLISYPLLMGRDLNFNSYKSVACSGATMMDINSADPDYSGQNKNHRPRKDYTDFEVTNVLTQFNPGNIYQLNFVSKYQPKAITISIGGNDIGFSGILKRCLEPDTCYSSYEDRVELVRQINSKFNQLVNTYNLVKNSSAPDTSVYAIGYPQLANPAGNCALNVQLNSDELHFSKLLISYLDGVIKSAADAAGVAYIDTQSALDGHKLCEAQPGSVAVNGLTAGNDFPSFLGGPIGKESYHPNDFGHLLLEQFILQSSNKLTKTMPTPNPLSTPPPEAGQEILQAPKTGRQINLASYDNSLAPDTVFKSTGFDAGFESANYSIKPGAVFQAVINSSPLTLGSFASDGIGNVKASLSLPASLTPGIHTLHFYGQDINSQKLDIYKVIYVGSIANDFDGDGIPNNKEACQFGEASDSDYDQDGIDDACDGQIIQPLKGTANTKPSNSDTYNPQAPPIPSAVSSINEVARSTTTVNSNSIPSFALTIKLLPAVIDASNSDGGSSALGTYTGKALSKGSLVAKPFYKNHNKGKTIFGGILAFSVFTGLSYRRVKVNK